jgi:putative membrane protein
MMWNWSGGMHWWGWLLGSIGMVALWGLIIWGIWYLVTGPPRQGGQPRTDGDAKRILDERLARGEISPEEYQRLRDLIRGDVGVSGHDGRDRVGAGDGR